MIVLYIGFEKTKTTLDDLLEFFGKYPNVLNVTKRLYEDRKDPERKKHFKGSVFVVFKDRDSAEKFMDMKSVKSPDGNEELIRKWQKGKYLIKNTLNIFFVISIFTTLAQPIFYIFIFSWTNDL